MNHYPVGKLRFYWIAIMTGLHTFWACMRIIVGARLVRDYRPFVDRTMQNWSTRLLSLVRVSIKLIGQENIPKIGERPVIIMCNHSSLYDIPVAIEALKISCRFVAKKELFNLPIFGSALYNAEFVSIDRDNREQALEDLRDAKNKMLDGITLWMAPEGTRSKDGKLQKFKRGGFHVAIDTNALIIPVAIKNIHKVQAGDNLQLYLNQEVEVEVCAPIDTTEYSVEKRKELINRVRNAVLEALGQKENT